MLRPGEFAVVLRKVAYSVLRTHSIAGSFALRRAAFDSFRTHQAKNVATTEAVPRAA